MCGLATSFNCNHRAFLLAIVYFPFQFDSWHLRSLPVCELRERIDSATGRPGNSALLLPLHYHYHYHCTGSVLPLVGRLHVRCMPFFSWSSPVTQLSRHLPLEQFYPPSLSSTPTIFLAAAEAKGNHFGEWFDLHVVRSRSGSRRTRRSARKAVQQCFQRCNFSFYVLRATACLTKDAVKTQPMQGKASLVSHSHSHRTSLDACFGSLPAVASIATQSSPIKCTLDCDLYFPLIASLTDP